MSKNKGKKSKKGKIGRPRKHGGYSVHLQDVELKKNPRIRQYLMATREGLIRDVAGTEEELSEQQRIVIDRIVSKLAILRLIEVYVEKHGIWRRDRLKKDQILELEPALGLNYLAFSNSVDRSLKLLGINKHVDNMKVTYLEDM